jgi:hypothetical protein
MRKQSCDAQAVPPQSVVASRPITLAASWSVPWSVKNLTFHDKTVPLSNQRSLGYRKLWVYCGNPACRHSAVLDADDLSDDTALC